MVLSLKDNKHVFEIHSSPIEAMPVILNKSLSNRSDIVTVTAKVFT